MKITKRDINLLLILLAIVLFLVCYLAYYRPTTEANQLLQGEVNALKPILAELKEKEAKLPEYEEGIRISKDLISTVRDGFPLEVRTEDLVMYAVALEEVVGIDTEGMVFPQPIVVAEFSEILAPDGTVEFEAVNAYKTAYTMNANLTYQHIKDLVDYVYNRSNKTTLDSVNVSYNPENGILFGMITVGKFYMVSESDPYIETIVPLMPVGVENPFGSSDTMPVPGVSLVDQVNDGDNGDGDNGDNGDGE